MVCSIHQNENRNPSQAMYLHTVHQLDVVFVRTYIHVILVGVLEFRLSTIAYLYCVQIPKVRRVMRLRIGITPTVTVD